jgi:hypothetical protein
MSRFLIILGVIFVALGFFWPYLSRLGLGRLPGDVMIGSSGFVFYFPLTTCLLISVILTIIFNRLWR